MELQGGSDMLIKNYLQYKTNNKLVLQHPIQYPPSSHNAIVDTGKTKYFVFPTTPLLSKKKTIIILHVKLPNGTVLK